MRERGARIFRAHMRQARIAVEIAARQHRNRAIGFRLCDKITPMRADAFQRGEQIAELHAAAIGGEASDLNIRYRGRRIGNDFAQFQARPLLTRRRRGDAQA